MERPIDERLPEIHIRETFFLGRKVFVSGMLVKHGSNENWAGMILKYGIGGKVMNDRIQSFVLWFILGAAIVLAAILPARFAMADQAGTFAGTWTANGNSEPFSFVAGREISTFDLAGNVSLKGEFGGTSDFWAQCVGLSDSVSGSSARCVWRGMDGKDRVYSVISGQPLKQGIQVTGEIVGGSGSLEGVSGTFTFTWTSTFVDRNENIFTGHTQNLSGSFQIP